MKENASQPPKTIPGYEELSLPISVPVNIARPGNATKPVQQTPQAKNKE